MRRLERREFLRAFAVVAGPPVLVACGGDESSVPPGVAPERYFPQSVASGDPRPESVVLWTRVVDPEAPGTDLTLTLAVATDPDFRQPVTLADAPSLPMVASAEHDGCVKVRLDGLAAGTTYYYRFTLQARAGRITSRVGRTRTAPDPESDESLKFAVVSCQDYGGKYFHAYRHLAEQELDFVLHLGDYIYETTADPSFQTSSPERRVTFRAPDEAIPLEGGDYFAARSLGNYRDLYHAYRSDPDLQRAHELFPFVVIPDDHEFSNDCHGATATYTNGQEDEEDEARRRAADRAWFEAMPVDYAEPPAAPLDEDAAFPDDFRLYRQFVFGRHLELVVTDLRRYRPDHVVPENAFPGAVFLDEARAKELLGTVPDDAVAYVSIDDDEFADVRAALVAAAPAQGFAATGITGLLSVPWIDQVLTTAGEAAPFDPDDADFERGYAFHQLLKSAEFSAQGSRYLLAESPFRALAAQRWRDSGGASERLLGAAQRAWFLQTLRDSTRTWKVWGNEYSLMQKVIDLTPVTIAPPELRQRIVLNADDWDGAPNERNALLTELAGVENVVAVTGDLHSFFAGTPYAAGKPETAVIELIAGSVTSTTWQAGIERAIAADPTLPPQAALIAGLVGPLLMDDDTRPNPHIGWLDLESNGYAVVAVGADTLAMTTYSIPDTLVAQPPAALDQPLAALFTPTEFRVASGSRTLENRQSGAWKAWDVESMSWV
jgi:alkaline phosphatase D